MSSSPDTTTPHIVLDGTQALPALEDNPEFNEWLNKRYGVISFGEYSYNAADVLYKMNPAVYLTHLDKFLNSTNKDDIIPSREISKFDEQLNQQYGIVRFGEYCYDAADVFRQMDETAYRTSLEEDQSSEVEEGLIETHDYQSLRREVCNNYPPLIAYSLHRIFNSVNYKERLERLRDVWESVVYLLHAFIVAEYRYRGLKFSEASVTLAQLFNEGIDHRLTTIKKLLDYATEQSISLQCHSMIPAAVLMNIAALNKIRNQFSHGRSLAEPQAQEKFEKTLPQVKEILLNLEGLKQKYLLRYIGAPGGILKPEFEKFVGFDLQPQTYSLQLEVGQLTGWSTSLREKVALTIIEKDLWNLSPFVYLNLRSGRHVPDIWVFKKKRNAINMSDLRSCELLFEDVGSSEEKTLTGENFRAEIRELDALCQ